jgi:hypothetical protein
MVWATAKQPPLNHAKRDPPFLSIVAAGVLGIESVRV